MRFLRGEEEEEAGSNLLELFGTIGIRSVRYDRLIMHLGRCAGNGEGEGSRNRWWTMHDARNNGSAKNGNINFVSGWIGFESVSRR